MNCYQVVIITEINGNKEQEAHKTVFKYKSRAEEYAKRFIATLKYGAKITYAIDTVDYVEHCHKETLKEFLAKCNAKIKSRMIKNEKRIKRRNKKSI